MTEPLLRAEGISKAFPGVQALDRVTLEIFPGEIHGLVGENGAGKSTLIRILAGAIPRDAGRILWQGQPVEIADPRHARRMGIAVIHQELSLLPNLTVAENLFLGREPRTRWGGLNRRAMEAEARRILRGLDLDLDVRAPAGSLPFAQRQMLEIARALSENARLLIMDEPTSALSEREIHRLFQLLRDLKGRGVAILFISHRLEEVFQIADRITVLRDGRQIGTFPIAEVTPSAVVRMMVGREMREMFAKTATPGTEVLLEVRGLTREGVFHEVSFEVRRGEIVGLAGLVGAGRTEVARALFGLDPVDRGEIRIEGRRVRIRSPIEAIQQGIAFIPEDRKAQALFLSMALRSNIAISALPRIAPFGLLSRKLVDATVIPYIRHLDIRPPRPGMLVRHLSGGNQQKAVLARWLVLQPKILIMDEPTRGIDVGAKAEIHALMDRLAREGKAILMISSELPEILGISDRILVMREGRIVGELSRAQATADRILALAMGGRHAPAA
ncbi:sugar ABC transporter ATP-binding protein [Thermoflexus sp.]|uniref:sugar ABC transporter ATP-binding protein n=1 Tax=Thermoflexus sp. TaxID=1969742 RepID=UPI0035E46213